MLNRFFGYAAAGVLAVTSIAQALPEFEALRPALSYNRLIKQLPSLGLGAVPTGFRIAGLPANRISVLRQGALVAQISYQNDVRHGITDLRIFDVHGKVIAETIETSKVCHRYGAAGLCRSISFSTELEAAKKVGKKGLAPSPFLVVQEPGGYGMHYYRYGVEENPVVWSSELQDSMAWVRNVLQTSQDIVVLKAGTPSEAILISLASEPSLAAYLPYLKVQQFRKTGTIISGVVPSSAAYSLVVRALLRSGARGYHLNLIIDSRFRP